MLLTESQLRKVIKSKLKDSDMISEIFGSEKKDETAFVKSKLQSRIFMSSENLRDSIQEITSDPGRGEVRVVLSKSGRAATDREVACAVENFMKKIRDKLSLNWIVKPCRYDDNIKKDAILIVGI